jgi:hypothetical protein
VSAAPNSGVSRFACAGTAKPFCHRIAHHSRYGGQFPGDPIGNSYCVVVRDASLEMSCTPFSDVEQEAIVLNAVWGMIDGMVNYAIFDKGDAVENVTLLCPIAYRARWERVRHDLFRVASSPDGAKRNPGLHPRETRIKRRPIRAALAQVETRPLILFSRQDQKVSLLPLCPTKNEQSHDHHFIRC